MLDLAICIILSMPDKYVDRNISVPNIHTQQQQQHIQHNRRGLHSAYKRDKGLNELREKKRERKKKRENEKEKASRKEWKQDK